MALAVVKPSQRWVLALESRRSLASSAVDPQFEFPDWPCQMLAENSLAINLAFSPKMIYTAR